ncbi:Protein GUCD1 [Glycine max]|nr:Protein GUCD1 [Glycine max]
MWPICLLFNKILKAGDEGELKGDNLNAIDPYLFQQPSINIDSHPPSLRCSHFIERFAVAFSYFTVTFGANPNYSIESFYKEELPNDLVRVDLLFQKAVEAGIDIQCRSISAEEISILILSGKYIAIVLVDHNKLSHVLQEDVPMPGLFSNNPGYTGHYVLICGYDAGADMFEIRDPASSKKHKRISSKSLEEARNTFGTDEDLLLISLEKSSNHHQPFLQLSNDVNTDS